MKNSITLGLLLLSLTAFANKPSEPIANNTKTESNTKVVDICSISETRNIEGFTITFTITATTCEEVQTRLNNAFAKAKKALSAA
jgi:hypothetical protein